MLFNAPRIHVIEDVLVCFYYVVESIWIHDIKIPICDEDCNLQETIFLIVEPSHLQASISQLRFILRSLGGRLLHSRSIREDHWAISKVFPCGLPRNVGVFSIVGVLLVGSELAAQMRAR